MKTELTKLGSVCKFLNGGTPTKENAAYFDGDIAWITGADITSFKVTKARSFITEKAIKESATNLVSAGTVLLVTRTSVGKVAVAGMTLCFSQDITAIRNDEKHLDKSFLIYFLKTKEPYFKQSARGATIGGITREVVSEIEIPLPSLPEQKRIAAILDKADRLRRQRRFAQTLSDSFLQSVFIKMFGDPVSNPMNWEVSLLGKACVPKDGIKAGPFGSSIKKDSYSETGVRVYGQEQVIVDNYRIGNYRISEKKFQEMKAYAVQPDDILISLVGTFGKVSIVPKDAELGIINPRLIRMRLNQEKLKSIFFREIFRNNSFLRKMQIMSHGGTMGILNGAQLKEIEIILPSLPLQEKFAEIVKKFERVRRQQREAARQAEHLFQTLLHRAFRGEL
jgi:type I restriction enzyme S subunit